MPSSSATPARVPIPDLPADVRAAFDAAIDARRRFGETFRMDSGRERINVRRQAVNDLAAANRVLAAHLPALVQVAARAAQSGGAR